MTQCLVAQVWIRLRALPLEVRQAALATPHGGGDVAAASQRALVLAAPDPVSVAIVTGARRVDGGVDVCAAPWRLRAPPK